MRANKKEKYERALIGVLEKLYTIFNRTIFFVFEDIKNNFCTQQEQFAVPANKILKIVLACGKNHSCSIKLKY